MIKHYIYQFASALLLAAAMLATSTAHASTPSVSNPATLEEMQEVLRQTSGDQLLLYYFRKSHAESSKRGGEYALDLDVFLAPFTLELLNKKAAMIYRLHLSHEYAQKLLIAANTPGAKITRRMIQAEMIYSGHAVQAEFQKLSMQERNLMMAYRNSSTFKSLQNTIEKSRPDIGNMFKYWVDEVSNARYSKAKNVIADLAMASINADSTGEVLAESALQQTLPLTGVRIWDDELASTLKYLRNRIRLEKQFSVEYDKLKLDDAITPESLVDAKKLEEANLAIVGWENLYAEEVKERDKLMQEFQKNILSLAVSEAQRETFTAKLNSQNSQLFDLQIRLGEQMRILRQQQKQLLELCEKDFGKIKLENGTLIFPDTSTLESFNALVAQSANTRNEIKKLVDEDSERRLKNLARFKKL